MSRIDKLSLQRPNGSFTDPIDIGAKASNVLLPDGRNIQEALGNVGMGSMEVTTSTSSWNNSKIYLYMGSTTGSGDSERKQGHWYYYYSSKWWDGGSFSHQQEINDLQNAVENIYARLA